MSSTSDDEDPFPRGDGPDPGPSTPISPCRHWYHRHCIEAAFDRPTVTRFDDLWFISSEVAVEMRRLGMGELFDRRAELITRQRVGPGPDVEVLDVCWVVEDWMVACG